MRVLYAALFHDPRNPDLASGVDHNFYKAMLNHQCDVEIVGPINNSPLLIERLIKKAYKQATGKRYLKWHLSCMIRASRLVNKAEKQMQPDVVFSIFPATIAFYRGRAPVVFNTDTTFRGWQEGGAGFGNIPLALLADIERRAVHNSQRL